jgi:hypothetical protein
LYRSNRFERRQNPACESRQSADPRVDKRALDGSIDRPDGERHA